MLTCATPLDRPPPPTHTRPACLSPRPLQVFRSFEMWSRVGEDGYSGLVDATAWPSPKHDNLQWRWWMAECVKYL